MDNGRPSVVISDRTKISLTAFGFAALLGTMLSIAWTGFNIYNELKSLKDDHYGRAEASEAALRTAIANPGMRVPDPRRTGEYIVVSHPGGDQYNPFKQRETPK